VPRPLWRGKGSWGSRQAKPSTGCSSIAFGAEATATSYPPLNLTDALELTILIARKDPRRHPRVAGRWLLRYLDELDDATIDEAAMVAACLATLAGDRYPDAALALRAMAERAISHGELAASP
jgi:hypothetical protein